MISTAELDLITFRHHLLMCHSQKKDNFQDGWDIAAIEEQEKTIHIDSISGKRYSILKTMNNEGLFLDQAKHIPLRR